MSSLVLILFFATILVALSIPLLLHHGTGTEKKSPKGVKRPVKREKSSQRSISDDEREDMMDAARQMAGNEPKKTAEMLRKWMGEDR